MDRNTASVMEAKLLEGVKVMKFNSHGGVQERLLWLDKTTRRLLIHKRKTGDEPNDSLPETRLRRAQSFFFQARDAFHRRIHDISTVKVKKIACCGIFWQASSSLIVSHTTSVTSQGIDIADVAEVRPGTDGWPDITTKEISARCLSIVGSERSIRIQLPSKQERDSLWIGLQVYLRYRNPAILLY